MPSTSSNVLKKGDRHLATQTFFEDVACRSEPVPVFQRPASSAHCGRFETIVNRRHFLQRAGAGFGSVAFAHLLASQRLLAAETPSINPLAPIPAHFAAKARSVIWLFMEGAPSAVDTFDPKPELTRRDGQKIQIDVFNGNPGP